MRFASMTFSIILARPLYWGAIHVMPANTRLSMENVLLRDTGKPSFICDFMSRLLESEANAYTHVVGKQFIHDMGLQRVVC